MKRADLQRQIRSYNLLHWADRLGRSELGAKVGDPQCGHLNQLLKKHGSFGNKVADKYEEALKLPPLWLDTPHMELWTEDQRNELAPYLSGLFLSSSLIDLSIDAKNPSIKEFLEKALSIVDASSVE